MGFGTLSSTFVYVPRHLPSKPASPPSNVAASTNRGTIYIAYSALVDGADGGSAILSYNIYIDDGMDGDFTMVATRQSTELTWDTAGTVTLT